MSVALLYADEDFDVPVVLELRTLGHDVICVHEVGRKGNADPQVLAFATSLGRAVLTFDHTHFSRLHRASQNHAGVVSCSRDSDVVALAIRIDAAITQISPLAKQFIRVVRPP